MTFVFQQEHAKQAAAAAPLAWLASFPRSGNTLLRVVLKSCFGLYSHSVYSDTEFPDAGVSQMVGEQAIGPDPQAFLRNAQRQGRTLFVKTHELPGPDSHPAIHMLRDGRSALVSRAHFERDILGRPRPLTDIIADSGAGNWSAHARAWMARPGTLTLRYEKLIAGDAATLAAIGEFTGRPQVAPFAISFARLHEMSPSFFRKGSDSENIAELDAEACALFERLHGETLRGLGY